MTGKSFRAFVICLALAVLAAVFSADQTRAHEFTFANGMTAEDGVPVRIRYRIDYVEEFKQVNNGQPLAPGQSDRQRADALYESSCLVQFSYKIDEKLPGCQNGNKVGVWITRYHNWCADTVFTLKRDGCGLVLETR